MIIFRFNAIFLSVFLLSACSEKFSDEDLICDQSPGLLEDVGDAAGQQKIVEQCIHKWAYRLGRAPGTNREIAETTLAVCRNAQSIFFELDGAERKSAADDRLRPPLNYYLSRFDDKALFRVTQGRAGNCPIRGEDQK